MNIVYLHGLSSSGQSATANKLRELFPDDNVIAPDLPVHPNEVLNLITGILQKLSVDDTIVIGSSMGAMFAHQQAPFRRILINPAFHVSTLLRENIGKTLQFFSQRMDGISEFTVTEELCSLYEQVEEEQFEYDEVGEWQDVIGIFGLQDNLVDCKDEFTEYYSIYHEFAGGHRLTDADIETILKPIICWMNSHTCPEPIPARFEDIESGDTGIMRKECDNIIPDSRYSNIPTSEWFKIFAKGVGRKWFDEIRKEYEGKMMDAKRQFHLTFPELPNGESEDNVHLVLGNRYCCPPSVEIYGKNGVQVFDLSKFYIDGLEMHCIV